jgi:hypothetical protein
LRFCLGGATFIFSCQRALYMLHMQVFERFSYIT